MELRTRFTERLSLRTPIAQAGMAFVGSTPDLAVAVGNAGGLGSLGVGLMPAPALKDTIAAIRAGTSAPFNVNFITPFTTDELIDVVCEAGVAVASFHWGHPSQAWIDRLHAARIQVFEQIGTVDDARRAVGAGVDVVVAQGLEAGGHNFATLPTVEFVPQVVAAVTAAAGASEAPALVLASGGIADGRGLAAALRLGADGAWVGTRLVATIESAAHPGYKARLIDAAGTDTVRTGIFGPENPSFNPMRVLRNRIVREWADRVGQVPTDTSHEPIIGHTVLNGQDVPMHRFSNLVPMRDLTTGDLEEMALLAGEGVGLVDAIEPTARVIERMTREAVAALREEGNRS